MRVLISAYACEPGQGSEPGVGWNCVRQIAQFAEVWVITRASNREGIEKGLAGEPLPHAHWVYFDLPRWARFWKKQQRGVHLYYYLWQIGAYRLGKALHRRARFDLVHHVTFVNYWLPSLLALLPVPFIWGPVGGGDSAPRPFYRTFSRRGRAYEHVRDFARWLGEHDPFVRGMAKRTVVALAATPETAERLRRLGARQVEVLSQVALADEEIRRLATTPVRTGNPFRLLSLGRLLHWKGFHLGIRAFARLVQEFPQSEYWFIGDGPERRNLARLASRLGVSDKVRFWGALPRQEVLGKLAEVDALVHPSLHDSGGWACLEAMAAGRPVICLALGGPALQVAEGTGFKVSAHSPEQVVNDMAEAMKKLATDKKLPGTVAELSRKRVERHFSPAARREALALLYRRVLAS